MRWRTTFGRTSLIQLHGSHRSNKIETSRLSFCWEWPPVMRLISSTKIGIVNTGLVLHQRPDPTSQETLIQPFIPVTTPPPHVLQHLLHPGLEYFPPARQVHPGPPQPGQNEGSVCRVVSHHVEGQSGGEPLLHSCLLPGGESAVQVSGHHQVHRGVQDGDESPQHSEQRGDIAQLRQAVNWTEIQTRALL